MDFDRRLRNEERPTRAILGVWVVLCIILLLTGLRNIAEGRFPDPDDTLRLVQVRDLLAGQAWFDLHQYRIAPPEGSLMHWSRIVDIPLAGFIGALTPLFGSEIAERITLVAMPLLTLLAILLVVGRTAWRLFDTETAIFACLCVGLIPPLVFQVQPMRIDHHGYQILTVAIALWAISWRSQLKGGAMAGLAMAIGLAISIELLPMVGAYGGLLFLRWVRDRRDRWWLVSYMKTLALGLVIAFFATRGSADLAQHCDVIAPAHLGFFLVTALATGLIAALPPLPRLGLITMFGAAGIAGLGFFAVSSPTCVATPFGTLDPLVRDYWYLNIAEGRPIWEQPVSSALPALLQMLVALGATLVIMARNMAWLRRWWFDYALLLAAAILAGIFTSRSIAFAGVIAAIPLGWLAKELLRKFRVTEKPAGKAIAAASICVVLLPAAPVALASAALPSSVPESERVALSQCDLAGSVPKLDNLPRGTVFAPLDIGPSLLSRSHHGVIATGHHRAAESMRDVIAAFTSPESEARPIIARYASDYVVMCTDITEAQLYAAADDQSLAAALRADEAPAWLEPVDLGTPDSFRVWKVATPSE